MDKIQHVILFSFPWLTGLVVVILTTVAIQLQPQQYSERPLSHSEVDLPQQLVSGMKSGSAPIRFQTLIHRPTGPPRIALDPQDPLGRTGSIACSTCHSNQKPNFTNRTSADLDQFHQQLPFSHGSLTCYACHNPDDADTLRLADGTTVSYPDAMTLCAQCHGPQMTSYLHGVHGGMNGYWDQTRGPRTRNHCIDCHDPHVPKFPKMQPTAFKPYDRFLYHESHATVKHD